MPHHLTPMTSAEFAVYSETAEGKRLIEEMRFELELGEREANQAKQKEDTRRDNSLLPIFKVLILGDAGVGVKCLFLRFVFDTYTDSYLSSAGCAFAHRALKVENSDVNLQVWPLRKLDDACYRGADAIIVAYDTTSKDSFDHAKGHIEDARRFLRGSNSPVLLVGTKSDLDMKREVSTAIAEQYAKQENLPFFECSAKQNTNVEEIFVSAVQRSIREKGIVEAKPQVEYKGREDGSLLMLKDNCYHELNSILGDHQYWHKKTHCQKTWGGKQVGEYRIPTSIHEMQGAKMDGIITIAANAIKPGAFMRFFGRTESSSLGRDPATQDFYKRVGAIHKHLTNSDLTIEQREKEIKRELAAWKDKYYQKSEPAAKHNSSLHI
jgi:small GTP-binding protein